jgi:excisionase family DNA binding protein
MNDAGTAPTSSEAQGLVPQSVPQAARVLGISERAVRKRITAGSLPAERDGRQWIVYVPAVPNGTTGTIDGTTAAPSEPSGGTSAVPELLMMIREKDRTIMELAGQVGYLQAELAQAREQLALAPPVDDPPERRSWWRRVLGS